MLRELTVYLNTSYIKTHVVPSLIRFFAIFIFFVYATSSYASPLAFRFSFTNPDNVGGQVVGIITGLQDIAAVQHASSVKVISNSETPTFGEGEYIGSPSHNDFTVTNGNITSAYFLDAAIYNSSSGQSCCSLVIQFNAFGNNAIAYGLSDAPSTLLSKYGNTLQFTPIHVDGPPSLYIFASGLAAIGLFCLLRKRKTRQGKATA